MPSAPPYGIFVAVLMTQGPWASFRTPRLPPAEGPQRGMHGEGPPFRILAVGDSIIAGVGVANTSQALPSRFSEAFAPVLSRRVYWRAAGRNGQRSAALAASLGKAKEMEPSPELVLVSNGINDVTRPDRPGDVLKRLQAVLQTLEQLFPSSIIAQLGLPPLGRFPALPQPLRAILGARATAIDTALGQWVEPRPRMLHLPFDEPTNAEDFAQDGYHPNAGGVQRWASHLVADMQGRLIAGLAQAS